jgi:hypothetical protein
MINECGAIGGMRIDGESQVLGKKPVSLVHHKSHMTCPGIENGPPW